MTVIIDYGMGNLQSVANAADILGFKTKISADPALVAKATKLILPGVGHFGKAVNELKKRKLFTVIQKSISQGVSFLGICLGMQLLLDSSAEAVGVKGLGVITGTCKKFSSKSLMVPQMGWNSVKTTDQRSRIKNSGIFAGLKQENYFYFAHSYYCVPKDKTTIAATTQYGITYASSLNKDNVWAIQFHPEKSQAAGLKLFNNFLKI